MKENPHVTNAGNGIKLALAWGFVGIPLVWGVVDTGQRDQGIPLTRIIHQVAIGRREAGRRGASFRGVGDAVVGV